VSLTDKLIRTRKYLNQWESEFLVTDTETGRMWHPLLCTPEEPTQAELDVLITSRKMLIQQDLDYEANDLNLTTDEDALLDYYRGIKRDVILRIRQYPGATLQQAADYISSKYPDSPFAFNELYQQWLQISGCSNWAQFKQFVIDHKFRDID